jgi:hypothetical protein
MHLAARFSRFVWAVAIALAVSTAGCGIDSGCPKAFTKCGNVCVDPSTDTQNCGGCGQVCPAGQVCAASLCTATCAPGFVWCNGACLDARVDPNDCGSCGNACSGATPICFGSACVAKVKVLVVGADASADQLAAVQGSLLVTGAFSTVDTFSATSATPTLVQLQSYAAVLVYSAPPATFADPATLGNNLADYWDIGGRVVLAWAANQTNAGVTGRFGTAADGYLLVDSATVQSTANYLGDRLEPASPLLGGVEYVNVAGGQLGTGDVVNGGVVVARWSQGAPAVVRGLRSGRNRCDVNMPPYSTGDSAALLRNALLYR